MEKNQLILSVKDLNIKFNLRGKVLHAIRGIDLDIYHGEVLAIVGESGSGKSVFTKSFMGLLDANGSITSGTIDYYGADDGKPIRLSDLKKEKDWLKVRGHEIAMIMQDPMTSLNPLKTIGDQIMEVICTLDSINHITKEEDVTKAFERVAFFMDKDGLFVFDVNTVYKHEQVLANNTFVYETDKVFCVWQNTLRENCVTDIDLDFFEEENGIYYRTSESFSERGYSREKLTEMLVNAGFELEAVYGDMSFDEPKADEQRLVFVARMKNPINKEC